MSDNTGFTRCTCSDEMTTAGKPWCPIHDNYAGLPPEETIDDMFERHKQEVLRQLKRDMRP